MCKSWVVSLQCVYVWCIWVAAHAQRRCCCSVYMIAMHVNRSDKAKNRSIYCIMQTCRCTKAESCLCNICMNVVYELNAESSAVTALYVIAMCVNRFENEKNQLICCITQVCRCAKAESCLHNVCVCDVYELNVWIKRCYCSVCNYVACKSIWKCEKSIDLLHHICLYVRKSWVVRS